MHTIEHIAAGDFLHGFDIVSVTDIPELDSKGIFARHRETGCEVYHLLNDDEENLFSYAFRTPPEDSTGVAHILEHSVLCGSKNYPLKDPFLVLAKQSVKTFLNAMTFPDKTVYPASSMVEADYFNLMAVYGDAVFFPLLDPWIFRQEGHRIELGEDGSASVQGIVFNEMRGNYSSFDTIAGDWSVRSILEGTMYAHDSGGDPACIPDLTYEQFREFHRKYYHPVNCRIFLHGNIPTEKQLSFLQERFLSSFSAFPAALPSFSVERRHEPRTIEVPAPSKNDDDRCTIHLNWLLGEVADAESLMEAALVSEILLGHDGAPLSRALLESGLGEDVAPSSGLETELHYLCYSAGLRGVVREDAGKVEQLVLETLEDVARNGVSAEDLETAIHSIDFSNREIRRSHGPFALTHMRRSLRGWIHGYGPEQTLRFIPAFEKVKKRVAGDPSYISGLVRAWFLDNGHRDLVVVYPDSEYEKRLDDRLSRIATDALNAGEEKKAALLAEKQDLAVHQETPDAPESLARIPHVSRGDLPAMAETIPSEAGFSASVPVIRHEVPSNGIAYMDIAFPVDMLAAEEYLLLPLFASVLTSSGMDGLNWVEASAQSARYTGGLGTMLFTSSTVPGYLPPSSLPAGTIGRDYLIMRVKMLEELAEPAVKFVFRCIETADFSDTGRLEDLLSEYRNDLESSLAPAGHHYASSLAAAPASRSKAVDELWNGITQLYYVRELCTSCKEEGGLENLSARLSCLRKRLSSGGMLVSLTGTASAISLTEKALAQHTAAYCAPFPAESLPVEELVSAIAHQVGGSGRLLVEGPLQVGFAAAVLPAVRFGDPVQGSMTVLSHYLSSGPLWERIRMAGGAYGAFCQVDLLEGLCIFSSYRDPSPLSSLDVFYQSLSEAGRSMVDETSLEKIITGCYSREVQPRSPADKGFVSFIRLLYGITDEQRRKKIESILAVTPADLAECAQNLSRQWIHARQCVLAGKKMLNDNKSDSFTGIVHRFTV